jgi:proline iminopeptidase
MKFHPINKPSNQYMLRVSNGHEINVEEYGNKNGIPMLFLHGGPGAGTSPVFQKYFNPNKYRLIMFDQRGCGKSTPYGEVADNTTQDLIQDINLILGYFNIDKTHIYGGSWGSTLALLYAEAYPEKVLSLTLRGIFLCRKDDINWFYQNGASEIYPQYWENYISIVDQSKRENILSAYHEMIFSGDETSSNRACKEWSLWEGKSSCLIPSNNVINSFDECAVSLARIESHFFMNNCFIRENQILEDINKIKDIPCIIVHGQYDIVCPIRQAYDLHKVYDNAELIIAKDAGHSLLEPSISKEILNIFDNVIE